MFATLVFSSCTTPGKHLFILSGQSNMARLDPNEAFTPAVVDEFGEENVLVVKDAVGGQPIRRWYKNWQSEAGSTPENNGDLYDRLMSKVDSVSAGSEIQSVTFVWMQGERDAREEYGGVYESSLTGLLNQLRRDTGHQELNFVIGRLSDFDLDNSMYPDWTMLRNIQVRFAESSDRGAWIDTDDLNDGLNQNGIKIQNDLHMSVDGYRIMGQRFAEKAIALIRGTETHLTEATERE